MDLNEDKITDISKSSGLRKPMEMKKRRKRAPKAYKNHEDLQKEFLDTTLVKKSLWNENWLDGYQYYMLLKNQQQLNQVEYPLLSEHPTWIYEHPRSNVPRTKNQEDNNGHIYFLCDIDLEKDGTFKLGFPRTPQLNKKSWKWKRNNFPTKLPKNDPKIVYICATTEGISYSEDGTRNLKRYRMHIAKLIELYDKEQRGETKSEGIVLCQMLEIEYGRTKEGKKYIPKPIGLVKNKNLMDNKEKTASTNGKLKRKKKQTKIDEKEEEREREEWDQDQESESVYLPSSQNLSDDNKEEPQDQQFEQSNDKMQINHDNNVKLEQCEIEQEKIEDVTDIFVADISRDQKSASSEEKMMIKQIQEGQNVLQQQQQDTSSQSIKSQIQMFISSLSIEGDSNIGNNNGLESERSRNLIGSENRNESRMLLNVTKQELDERQQYQIKQYQEQQEQRNIFDDRNEKSIGRFFGMDEIDQKGKLVFRESYQNLYQIQKQGNHREHDQLEGQSQEIQESLIKSKRITKKKKKQIKGRKQQCLIKKNKPKIRQDESQEISLSWKKNKNEQRYLSPITNESYNLELITPPLFPQRKQFELPSIQQENELSQEQLENSQSKIAMKVSYQTPKNDTQSRYDKNHFSVRFNQNYDSNNILKSPRYYEHNSINIFEDNQLSLFNQVFSPVLGQKGFNYCSNNLRYVSSIKKPFMNDQQWIESNYKDYQISSGMKFRSQKNTSSFVNGDLQQLVRDSSEGRYSQQQLNIRNNNSRSYTKFSPGLHRQIEESENKRNKPDLNDLEIKSASKNLFQSQREQIEGRVEQDKENNRRKDNEQGGHSLESDALFCLKPVSFFKWNKRNSELYAFIR